jgi:hypothetical protein
MGITHLAACALRQAAVEFAPNLHADDLAISTSPTGGFFHAHVGASA